MKEFISMGLNSSIMLLSQIEDIIDLSRMEEGTFTITKALFSIENLINEVKDVFHYQ
jgi:signal transduction histidine kinase